MKKTVNFSQIGYGQKFVHYSSGEELIKYKRDRARPSGTLAVGRLIGPNERCEIEIDNSEISSGLGIGGAGSDDYNISTSGDLGGGEYIHGEKPAGAQVCPAGTTYGRSDPGGRCARCGAPADWNPSAGENLCSIHWDEY